MYKDWLCYCSTSIALNGSKAAEWGESSLQWIPSFTTTTTPPPRVTEKCELLASTTDNDDEEEEQNDRPTDRPTHRNPRPLVLVIVDDEREQLVECKSSTLRFVRINDDATGAAPRFSHPSQYQYQRLLFSVEWVWIPTPSRLGDNGIWTEKK